MQGINYLKSSGGGCLKLVFDQVTSTRVAQYTTDLYPYTTAMYKKNYIRYTVQSKQAIIHDYEFTGDERLPTFAERIQGKINDYNRNDENDVEK